MRQQTAAEFERANSRRLWTSLGFLFVLILVLVAMAWYLAFLLASGKGPKLVARWQQVEQCRRYHLPQAAAAAERYCRDKGHYPAHIEDVYPEYLADRSALRCPADTATDPSKSSFTYQPPDPAHPDRPMLTCSHHGPITLTVVPQGPLDPGNTEWEVDEK